MIAWRTAARSGGFRGGASPVSTAKATAIMKGCGASGKGEHPVGAQGGRGAKVTLARLAEETFIDFPLGWGNRAVVDRAFAAAGLDRQVLFEVADFAAAAGLIRNSYHQADMGGRVTALQQTTSAAAK